MDEIITTPVSKKRKRAHIPITWTTVDPYSVLYTIYQYLQGRDYLCSIRIVCKYWNKYSYTERACRDVLDCYGYYPETDVQDIVKSVPTVGSLMLHDYHIDDSDDPWFDEHHDIPMHWIFIAQLPCLRSLSLNVGFMPLPPWLVATLSAAAPNLEKLEIDCNDTISFEDVQIILITKPYNTEVLLLCKFKA